MHKVFSTEDRTIVVSQSRQEAIQVASSLQPHPQIVYSMYPPFSSIQLELLLDTILNSTDPHSDTSALRHLVLALEFLLEILSYVRERSSRGLDSEADTPE